jgi:hypothetical protein
MRLKKLTVHSRHRVPATRCATMALIAVATMATACSSDDGKDVVIVPGPTPTPTPVVTPTPVATPPVPQPPSYEASLAITPRLQWEANYGYCGEVALISAGLYYGQYLSQYDARALASPDKRQSTRGSQLLVGVNDTDAAERMHLRYRIWTPAANSGPKDFLAWVKSGIVSGFPVIIGVYENLKLFEDRNDPDAGDKTYDHIVPVISVSSRHPLAPGAGYYDDDQIGFSDNGLWSPSGRPAYVYRSAFATFQANRRQANADPSRVYSLPSQAGNHGIAIIGIRDDDGVTLPVRVVTEPNDETPRMIEGSDTRPASQRITLSVMVSGLKPGVRYNLYRYDSFDDVPDASFNAKSAKAARKWAIDGSSGSTFSLSETIASSQTAIYRAVPVGAP